MKRRLTQTLMLLLAALTLLGATARVQAQAAYPNKPVKIVIGFGPGSGTDIMARMIAEELRVALGQRVAGCDHRTARCQRGRRQQGRAAGTAG